ncbi:hypothetical protein [Nocardioides lentus]|uniref:hypothetical protein n=1 Tax=Nocardioides lentus TaxID=338077 RepID=UPI0031E40A68
MVVLLGVGLGSGAALAAAGRLGEEPGGGGGGADSPAYDEATLPAPRPLVDPTAALAGFTDARMAAAPPDPLVLADQRLFRECRWVLAAGRALSTSDDADLRQRGESVVDGLEARLAMRSSILATHDPLRWTPPPWRDPHAPAPGAQRDAAALAVLEEHTAGADDAARALGFDPHLRSGADEASVAPWAC